MTSQYRRAQYVWSPIYVFMLRFGYDASPLVCLLELWHIQRLSISGYLRGIPQQDTSNHRVQIPAGVRYEFGHACRIRFFSRNALLVSVVLRSAPRLRANTRIW